MKSFLLILLSACGLGLAPLSAQNSVAVSTENAFDRQVLDTLLGRGLTDMWDINGYSNRFNPGLPVAIRFSEWGSPIELGDAFEQRSITEPFELIVGFYEKLPNSSEANVVAVHDIKVQPEMWDKAWGKITADDLKKLQDAFKTGTDRSALFFVKGQTASLKNKGGLIQLDPRISKNQRKIACYIPFEMFHTQFLNDPIPKKQQGLTLWGKPFKSKIELGTKPQENVVATIDRNGQPVTPNASPQTINANQNSANPPNAKKRAAKNEPAPEVKVSKVVMNESNRIGPATAPEEPKKATPEEIAAAIEAAKQGKITPNTPGAVIDKAPEPLPTVDTGWQKIDMPPVKVQ